MDSQYIEAGEATNLSSNTFTAPALGTSYTDANNNTISGTPTTYWKFNGWNTAADGTGTAYTDQASVTDLAQAGQSITLYAQWQATPVLVVNYEGNGMEFDGGATQNKVGYYNECAQGTITKNSHTSNINDDGTQIGTTKYDNNLATKDVVTISGASTLHATITYGTENNWDMLYVFQGTYTGSVTRNMSAGQLAKYMGGSNSTTTVELDIPGDTATFAFYSDGGGQYWGYYASVVGYDSNNEQVLGPICSRSIVSGEYQNPAADEDRLFQGWSENSSAITPDYTSANDVLRNLPGDNNQTKTLYAIWTPRYHINYVNNCYTYASANSSCTQSVSNDTGTQTIDLDSSGNGSATLGAYDYNSWTLTGWKIVGWNTAANGTGTDYPVSSTYSVINQSAGDNITLYAHWVPVYSIQYDGNGASNPNGMGTTDGNGIKSVKQINVGEGDQVTLLPSNFKRTGYSFAGWSTSPNATVGGNDKIYGPMETISAPAYPNNGTGIITMYAVWIAAEKDGNNKPIYLQDFGKNECDNLTSATFNSTTGVITPGSVIALTDKRDNMVYTIAKLADGNCWMTENLRLEHAGTVGNNINDSSVTNQSLSQGYGSAAGTYGNFVGLAEPESTNFGNTTSNTIYKSDGSGSVFNSTNNTLEDIGTTNYPAYRFPRYNNSNTNSLADSTTYTQDYSNATSPSDSGTNYNTDSNLYSYGNYYTWAAAMANTNYYYSSSTSEATGASICPSNWHLPSSHGTSKEFDTLSQSYGGSGNFQSGVDTGKIMIERFRSFPNSFLYSGYFVGSGMGTHGTRSYYWSRSSYSDSTSYILNMYGINFNPSFTESKIYGFSVRCIAGNIYTIQYDGNGADNPNGMGTTNADGVKNVKQVEIKDGTKVTLLASNFKRNSYGFAGWSTDPDAWAHFTDNDNTNDPTIYGPMEDVVINSSVSKQSLITMYAVWVPAEKDGSNNPVYLQDFTTSDCNALTSADFNPATGEITPGSVIALTDKRDNMVYTIAKLADGNCWMTENLRLEHAGTVGNNINDSNVTNQSLSQGYGGTPGTYGSFVGLAAPESYFSNGSTSSNSIYKSSANPPVDTYNPSNNVLEDIGTTANPGYRFPRYNHDNTTSSLTNPRYTEDYTDSSSLSTSGSYKAERIYSYGNYYSWAAAMASTKSLSTISASEQAGTSVCPSGWHLPSSGSATKEFGALSQGYGGAGDNQDATGSGDLMDSRFRSFPNNFLHSGKNDSTSSLSNRSTYGYYWSRSAYNVDVTYHFLLSSTNLYPSASNNKYLGQSIRCLIGS